MFFIQKSEVGITTEYLANAEEKHCEITTDFESPKLKQFLKERGLKTDGSMLTPELYNTYLDQQNPHYKARFIGRLANEWGLKEYDKKAYISLMSNKLPDNLKVPKGLKLKQNGHIITTKANAQTGTDTVSSAPKSVSIEFARTNKEQQDKIVNALNRTTEQLFEEISKQMKPRCLEKEYQDFKPGTCKLLITSFTHYENRGYIDENGIRRLEPNLHTHNSIKNYAEFEVYKHDENGNRIKDKNGNFITQKKMLAVDPEDAFKKQLENSAKFDTLLNSNLQIAGFKTEIADELGQTFRLCGYTKELENSLSSRTKEIKNFIEKAKEKGVFYSSEEQAKEEFEKSAYSKEVRQQTAKTKTLSNAVDVLSNIKETTDNFLTQKDKDKIELAQQNTIQNFEPIKFSKIAEFQEFETNGVIEETKIRAEIYKQVRFSQTFNSIDELENTVDKTMNVLLSEKMGKKQLIKMDDGRLTRLDIVITERNLQKNIENLKTFEMTLPAKELKDGRNFIANYYKERKKQGFKLNDGQLQSLKLSIKQNALSLCIGDAGSGKTSSFIHGTNAFYQSKNRTVYGLSVGTSISRDLVDGNVKKENCLNSKEFLMKAYVFKDGKNTGNLNTEFLILNKDAVLIFDEAGMCGAEDMNYLVKFINTARKQQKGEANLILVGDHKQLASVSYGNAFINIQNQLDPENVVRLEENTRQKNEIAKTIAESYRDKDIEKVFKTLEDNNLLITADKQDEVNKQLINDYLNDTDKSKLIVCGKNSEIDLVNDMVRKGLIEQEQAKAPSQRTLDFKNSHSIEVSRKNGIQYTSKKRSFCIGEELVFLKNSNQQQKKKGFIVSNSDRGFIKEIKKLDNENFKITVEIKGKSLNFETKDYNEFNHCYAVSTHKSQGKTVNNTYHLGNSKQARYQNSYVNGSRHKEQYKLYLAKNDIAEFKKNAIKESEKATTLKDKGCQKAYIDFQNKIREKELAEQQQHELQGRLKMRDEALIKQQKLKEQKAKELAEKRALEEKVNAERKAQEQKAKEQLPFNGRQKMENLPNNIKLEKLPTNEQFENLRKSLIQPKEQLPKNSSQTFRGRSFKR